MTQNALSRAAILCINGYQRHLSSRKGYSCAHRVLHGGEGCSAFVKRAIETHGLKNAWLPCRRRFSACNNAARVLRESREPLSSPSPFDTSTAEAPAPARPRNRLQRWWERQKRECTPWDCCNPCDAVHVCDAGHSLRGLPRAFDLCFDCGPADTGLIDCCSCWPF